MTSPLPPFPATMWVGWERPEESNNSLDQKKGERPQRHGLELAQVDAAAWLAGLTPAEVASAMYWEVGLPFHADDTVWAQPHLASLRPAWDQVKAQSKVNGDPADAPVTLDLSGGPLIEWLHQNLFATFLQSALMHLDVGEKEWSIVQGGRVGSRTGDDGDVKTLILTNINALGYSLDFDSTVDEIIDLTRFCAATNPKMDVDLMHDLTPYLVGSTPQCEWMNVDRALAHWKAGYTYGEARRSEFGAAANRPTDEMLATLAGLHVTSR